MSLLTAPLPGLYLGLLALLLGLALRRWWDPVPRRAWAVFGAVLVILFGPSLFLGKVLVPADILPGVVGEERRPMEGNKLQSDLVTQILPLEAQVRRSVKAGAWPVWNDLVGAGMPLLADPQSQALQPLVLAALPLPLAQAAVVTAGLRVLLALVFLFLLLRRQGISEGAALFGGLAYGLGGFLLLWLGWPLANSAALLPLALYALVVTDERGARRDFLLLALAAFSVLLAGHPETILHVALVSALFAGARLLRRPGPERLRLAGRWALAGALAFGLAAPALLPTLRFLSQAHRSHMVDLRNERIAAPRPARAAPEEEVRPRLVPVFAPNAYGNSRFGAFWGESNTNEDAAGFVGGAALLAALLAFAPARRRFPQERLFQLLAVICLVIPVRPPGVPQLLGALPVLNQSISYHHRLLFVLTLALAYLGACTVERWRAGEGPRRWVVISTAILLLGLVTWGYLGGPEKTDLLPLRHFSLALHLVVLAATATLLLLSLPPSPGEGGREGWGEGGQGGEGFPRTLVALVALVALELILIHRPANPSVSRDAYYPTSQSLAFLQRNAGGYRIAGLGDRLLPNAPSVYGLADIRISNPFKPYLYTLVTKPVSASARSTEHILIKAEHPVYQLLNVRYVVGPPRFKTAAGLKAVFRDRTARVFERQKTLPRIFLPAAAESAGERPWPDWVAANTDFGALSLVQPAPERPARWAAARPDESTLEILALEPARLTARTLLAEERLAASSVYQDGGWRLLLDGRPAPSTVANGPFVAAWLPAGEHRIELLYRAPGLPAGLALAALALAGLAAWLVPLPGHSRQTATSSSPLRRMSGTVASGAG